MKGTLSEGALPALLRAVYVGRKTGILHFKRGSDVRSVRFRQGHILSAQSTVANEHLGEVLVRNELLTAADLERAGARKRATGKRLGETLQEMGLVDPEHLEDALALHVREVLLAVFSWNDGEYELEEPAAIAFDSEPTLKLSTGEMILETVRLLQNPDVVRAALGNTDRVLDQSTDPLLRFQKVTLSPTDGYVLSRVDGTLKAREILEMIPLPQEEVEKSLYGLLCTGIIEFAAVSARRPPSPSAQAGGAARAGAGAPPPAPGGEARAKEEAKQKEDARKKEDAKKKEEAARQQEIEARRKQILDAFEGLSSKNHFEVLGIPRASSEAQVKEAYFQLARRFHPDTHHDPAMEDLGAKLEAVFIRLGQAYEVLRNPRSRAAYETDLASRAPRVPRPAAGRWWSGPLLPRPRARGARAPAATSGPEPGGAARVRGHGRGGEAHREREILGRDPAPRVRGAVAGGQEPRARAAGAGARVLQEPQLGEAGRGGPEGGRGGRREERGRARRAGRPLRAPGAAQPRGERVPQGPRPAARPPRRGGGAGRARSRRRGLAARGKGRAAQEAVRQALSRTDGDATSARVACRVCRRPLEGRGEFGWECDCGAVVCAQPECFEEVFKHVAGGEATRCLVCGQVT